MTPADRRAIQLAANAVQRSGAYLCTCVFNDNYAVVQVHPIGKPELARDVRLAPCPGLYNAAFNAIKREAALIGAVTASPRILKILPPMKAPR